MGWASGSELCQRVVGSISLTVTDPTARRHLYNDLIEAFTGHDCDTLDEVDTPDVEFHAALKAYNQRQRRKR